MVRSVSSELTREEEVMARVIEAIRSLADGAEIEHIRKKYLQQNESWLREEDFYDTQGGNDIRWRKVMDWALQPLKKEGVVRNSRRGYWELTESWKKAQNPGEKFRQEKSLGRAEKIIEGLRPEQKEELIRKFQKER